MHLVGKSQIKKRILGGGIVDTGDTFYEGTETTNGIFILDYFHWSFIKDMKRNIKMSWER